MAAGLSDLKGVIEQLRTLDDQGKVDLSSDEDLCVGVMNLISIEEHLFFTGEKTGKSEYFTTLNAIREMRKELLNKLLQEYEGEVWCIAKHLLAASMRLMEVGTKRLSEGNRQEAQDLFNKSYELYSLFWAGKLGSIGSLPAEGTKEKSPDRSLEQHEELNHRLCEQVGAAINCCVE